MQTHSGSGRTCRHCMRCCCCWNIEFRSVLDNCNNVKDYSCVTDSWMPHYSQPLEVPFPLRIRHRIRRQLNTSWLLALRRQYWCWQWRLRKLAPRSLEELDARGCTVTNMRCLLFSMWLLLVICKQYHASTTQSNTHNLISWFNQDSSI